MPYASLTRKREYDRRWQRENAARQALMFPAPVEAEEVAPEYPDDPVGAFVDWATSTLRVPTGPLTSKPFIIPDWQAEFLRGAFEGNTFEAGLSVARKNGKSGLIAAWLLACLEGPIVKQGFRAVVVSLTGQLSKELKDAMELTAKASDLQHVQFFATPPPGRAVGRFGSSVNFLAADKATGHAIGCDLAIIDEAGLLPEANRALWNAVLSSTSGRAGRLVAISIRGDGPMFDELAERAGEDGVYWKEYAAPVDAAYDDTDAWIAANPGLADGIKQWSYMERMSQRAISKPQNGPHFAAYDLNLPQEPTRELILTLAQWKDAVVETPPEKEGPCFLGIDLGGSSSMTAAVAYWPVSGRIECFGAFPAMPDLRARGEADGVGGLYVRMQRAGELFTFPGRVTPVTEFIDWLASYLAGDHVMFVGCDRYRQQEFRQALMESKVGWQVVFRGQGHGATADGSTDVRAFQSEVLQGNAKPVHHLMLESAIAHSSIAYDVSGNPKLDKMKQKSRIDALQAGVIALGMGRRWRREGKRRRGKYHGAV